MSSVHARVVCDLLAATESGHGDVSLASLSNGWKQTLFADGLSDVVMFDFVSERTGHAATAAVDFIHTVPPDASQQFDRVLAADDRFLMAVGVVFQIRGRFSKCQCPGVIAQQPGQ